jgi:hypothetical protein
MREQVSDTYVTSGVRHLLGDFVRMLRV